MSLVFAALFAAAGSLAPPSPDSLRQTVLRVHDEERRAVGSPPLEWDDALARDAASWAQHLARTRTFDHCANLGCPTADEGENLWMGTKGAYTLSTMLHGWSDEKRLLKRMSSWEDDYHAVGHYTQMVWADTSRVGCAIASNRSDEYLVCRYETAGNVMGESPFASSGRRAARGGAVSHGADDEGEGVDAPDMAGDDEGVADDEGSEAPAGRVRRTTRTTSQGGVVTTTTVEEW
jgi:hypothetical protein